MREKNLKAEAAAATTAANTALVAQRKAERELEAMQAGLAQFLRRPTT